MVKHSCHIHLTRAIREAAQPPHLRAVVSPAGAGETCDFCDKPASWTVNTE